MGGPVRAFIEGSPQLSTTTPAQTGITDTAAQILGLDPKRKGMIIQNTGTTVLKFVLGTATPTQTVYHIALGACTGADDGLGGTYFESSWVGAVQAISSAAGGTCVITVFRTGSPNWNLAGDVGTAML
jgi:hypothetical protein